MSGPPLQQLIDSKNIFSGDESLPSANHQIFQQWAAPAADDCSDDSPFPQQQQKKSKEQMLLGTDAQQTHTARMAHTAIADGLVSRVT